MPYLIQTIWNGELHHSIEYGAPRRRMPERLGVEHERLKITHADAARGIDALVAENFPEAVHAESAVFYGS